jgi:hypothetical protein
LTLPSKPGTARLLSMTLHFDFLVELQETLQRDFAHDLLEATFFLKYFLSHLLLPLHLSQTSGTSNFLLFYPWQAKK